MKNLRHIIAPLAVLAALASCSESYKEMPVVSGTDRISFTATINPATRISLASDGLGINWTAGDAITVFDGAGMNCKAEASNISDDFSAADFTITGTAASTYYAVYPYEASSSISGAVVSASLPAAQTLVPSSFASGSNVCVAKSSDNSFGFTSICDVLKITVPEGKTDIAKIVISTPAGEKIAGGFTVDLSGSVPVIAPAESASESVTLAAASGNIVPGTYYVPVLPVSISGLNVALTDSRGNTVIKRKAASFNLVSGKITNVGTVDNFDYDDQLAAWNKGYSIEIAGNLYERGSGAELSATVADKENYDIQSLINGKNAMLFLEEGEGCNFMVGADGANAAISENVIIASRYNSKPVTFRSSTLSTKTQISLRGGSISFKNVIIDNRAGFLAYFIQLFSIPGGTVEFDGCKILMAYQKNLMQFSAVATCFPPKRFVMDSCDVLFGDLSAGTNYSSILYGGSPNFYNTEEIIFTNNVIHTSTVGGCVSIINNGGTATPEGKTIKTSLRVENNSFINLQPKSSTDAFFQFYELKSLYAYNNLFYNCDTQTMTDVTPYMGLFYGCKIAAGATPQNVLTGELEGNSYYCGGSISKKVAARSNGATPNASQRLQQGSSVYFTKLSADPLPNLASGDFHCSVEGLGAIR